jgi:hypothetical protein
MARKANASFSRLFGTHGIGRIGRRTCMLTIFAAADVAAYAGFQLVRHAMGIRRSPVSIAPTPLPEDPATLQRLPLEAQAEIMRLQWGTAETRPTIATERCSRHRNLEMGRRALSTRAPQTGATPVKVRPPAVHPTLSWDCWRAAP